jgi:hypothetical protein
LELKARSLGTDVVANSCNPTYMAGRVRSIAVQGQPEQKAGKLT